ncbi:MAG TPA: adenylosuccinate lyase family protein [Actinomycetota bacterium]|nr:adenylosuccinate lyase family protein [Actinomycetota bacterium]
MGARVTDSALYGHLWGTDELRAIFDEPARIQSWLDILAALAKAQAEMNMIPEAAGPAIAGCARVELLDMELVRRETQLTGHSTLGLIRGLQAILPAGDREWVYYGATVQDLTDTWTSLTMKRVGGIVWRDLRLIEAILCDLAERHRNTVMAGRTHGQTGSPITFGYKAAGWADEVRRHLQRLGDLPGRCLVGQLGGGVGSLAFFRGRGIWLRRRFCELLGLADPGISWTSSRDRLAEFTNLLALAVSTLGRIGNEVYQLQRPEIGELREPAGDAGVGSITMPHKRNPELSEHLVTLARLVRSSAGVILEGTVTEHERDGRAWKAEWVAFPEVCLLTGTALQFARRILEGVEVDEAAMLANLSGWEVSERALSLLAPFVGKHAAQSELQRVLSEGRQQGRSVRESLQASETVSAHLDPSALDSLFGPPDAGEAPEMVDQVVARIRGERATDPAVWPSDDIYHGKEPDIA